MNVSNLGQDREHCQQLHRQLRKLRGVWAGVRCLHQEIVTQRGLWSQRRALVISVLTTCACLDRLPHLAES